ncbi:MAG: radical SAM protein [Elusimicrobiota bacterium]|nr:radical SAM protein [Elusimicrobiota bacterium]
MKRPSVLLIKSRSVVSKIKGTTPPLGILYIAACLRQRLGAEVRVVDAMFEPDAAATVLAALREQQPDVVGISALTAESFLAHKLASAVKGASPGTPVVMGGPHPTSDPDSALSDSNVDAVVMGEGEETFTELVRVIAEEGPRWREPATLRAVDGIAFSHEGKTELTRHRAPITDLDSLPFPAWDLIDYKKFWKAGGMATVGVRPYLPIFTSRGCPYHCVFCHQIFGKAFRARSPENVADEVAQIHKLGTRNIEVLDDISNFDPDRFDRMLELLLERELRSVLSFPNAIRADLIRESSIDLLKRVGAGEVSVAVETASERLQKLLKKNLSLDKVSRTIDMLANRRIFTRGFFMLGLPTETEEELRATIRFAHASRLHLALFFNPNPFHNTEMYEMFKKAGKLRSDVSTIDFEYFGAPFNASDMPDSTYRMLYRWAYYGFYLNPARAYRIARDGPFGWDIPARVYGLFRNYTSFRRLKES